MIIKGSCRGTSADDAVRLADHLTAAENERVDLLDLRGVVAQDLPSVLEEMRLVSLATRTRRPLYHASINVNPAESRLMPVSKWVEAADELETHLGLTGHQRVLVQHTKRGRTHLHVVWSRIDPTTLKVVHDGQSYRAHERCARTLEERWRLRPVVGVHTRPFGTPRPVARMTHHDHQAQSRTGVPVAAVSAALTACWRSTTDAEGLAAAIQKTGLTLAQGRRGAIVIDTAGTPHSLSRRLGITAAEVRRRLESLNITSLPNADSVTADRPKTTNQRRTSTMRKQRFEARRGRRKNQPPEVPQPLNAGYWRDQGYQVEQQGPVLMVTLSGGTVIEDRGDQLTLVRSGPPTDQEIALMVSTARARGWAAIRFTGPAEFQRRARLEAIRQGYSLSAISLECEDGMPRAPAMDKMPEHIRRRLQPDTDTPPEAPPPDRDTPTPPVYRP